MLFDRLFRALWVAAAVALTACGGGGDGAPAAPSTPPPAGVAGQVIATTIASQQNGFSYSIQIYLPTSYGTGTATLPAIYVTEGDAPYGPQGSSRFSAFQAAMQRRDTQAILVGISGTARRNTDFLLPGAAGYLHYIVNELAPTIERNYRADPRRRALSGLSHGGYFVVAALVLEGSGGAPSFSHYLSTDTSIGGHASRAEYLEFERRLDVSTPRTLSTTLFITGAREFNLPVADAIHQQMAAHAHPGLTLIRAGYETSHVGADLPAFEEALARFFP